MSGELENGSPRPHRFRRPHPCRGGAVGVLGLGLSRGVNPWMFAGPRLAKRVLTEAFLVSRSGPVRQTAPTRSLNRATLFNLSVNLHLNLNRELNRNGIFTPHT